MSAGANAGMAMGMGMMAQKAGEMGGIRAMEREEQSEKRMADYYYKLSMQKWNDTGHRAQVEQLKGAGLSTGLIYGQGGAGGQSSNVDTASRNVESGNQMMGVGMQLGSQLELTKAQTENIKAQTDNTKVDTQKKSQETTDLLWQNDSKQKTGEDGSTAYDVERARERAELAKTQQEKDKMIADVENKEEELRIMLQNANTQETRAEAQTKIETFKAEIEAMYQGTDKVTGRMLNEILEDVNRLTEQREKREERRRRVK